MSGRNAGGEIRELAPVLVTSPVIRSGTTLLQRLLCSSRNGLIYGEEVGKDLELQLQISASRQLVYSHSRQRFASSLERVLRGDTNDWLLDLMPEIDGYLEATRQGAFAGLAYCQQQAEQTGRHLWGFKYPAWPPYLMRLLFEAMPGARVIYIVRDLGDCLRSAKAWHALDSEAEVQQFCRQWCEHIEFMRHWQQAQPVLLLPFATLVDEPERAIEQLCGFLPFEHPDRDVLRHKINNRTQGADTRHGHNDYIAPVALTAAEQGWVDAAMAAAGPVHLGH